MTSDDWETLRDIRLRALADAAEAFGTKLVEAQALSEQQWRSRVTGRAQFIAISAGYPVGMVAAGPDPDGDGVYLSSMWVIRSYRGRGVSDQLIHAVVEWALGQGHRVIRLEVTEGNHHAERLYTRHGFARTGRTKPMADDDPRIEFEMTLII
ncbi:GNAT family N-acetyltransferase [Nocardia donostiensis]|uniref:GNAT family N-acetyltransferase n=1 Tax=Nocardia donostiensis TaxID=1538463 RepID=UPI001C37E0E8|nr:GNAT family N-acetyltransferase [Nocardia donostiensis]